METALTQTLRRNRSCSFWTFLFFYSFILLLTSCGAESGKFKVEGRLRNLNQGEFWVYSPDGGIEGIDTIKVRDSRFSYELDMRGEATLIIIFPNYSEQPVFAKSGAKVTIKGDASHLKEIIIEGTDDNKRMTQLRMELNRLTPPEIPNHVAEFIHDNPESPVSIYLLQRYFVTSSDADNKLALRLTKELLKAHPDNGRLVQLKNKLSDLQGGAKGSKFPKFTAKDLKGKRISESVLKGKVAVVSAWATWSYASTDMQRRLKQLKKQYNDKLAVLSVCIDGRPQGCRDYIKNDSLTWSTVCDGRMWDSPLMTTFGMADVPDNVLYDKSGKVVANHLSPQELEEKIKTLLK